MPENRHQEQALLGFDEEEIKTLTGFLERIQANISSHPLPVPGKGGDSV